MRFNFFAEPYVPAGHGPLPVISLRTVGTSWDVPFPQKYPIGQSSGLTVAVFEQAYPAGQTEHEDPPDCRWYFPGEHGVGAEVPPSQKYPGGQMSPVTLPTPQFISLDFREALPSDNESLDLGMSVEDPRTQ
jgi:hypothetical protein